MNRSSLASVRVASRHLGHPDILPLGEAAAIRTDALVPITARQLGSRIDTRAAMEDAAVAAAAADGGYHFIFRYGVVVSFSATDAAIDRLDVALAPHITEAANRREVELAELLATPRGGDRVDHQGRILLTEPTPQRLELVAIVLARSVVMSRDEDLVSEVFERIAPLVAELRQYGRARFPINQAMRLVGEVLAARHRVMGTVQADERPEVLWDNAELDRLYGRLEAEYELGDRAAVLERKFVALGDFAEVLLEIVQGKRALRLELAVIGLIAFEIALALIGMLPR